MSGSVPTGRLSRKILLAATSIAALAALAASAPSILPAAAPPDSETAGPSPGIAYTLEPETVPNGSFDRVAPEWRQQRPDEGETLTVVPEGWLAGYQGGTRTMPIPGVDPDTGGRCMAFLYGSGQVNIYTPPFPLTGEGTYLLSIRTRSVFNPSPRALRVVVRLLRPEEEAGAAVPSFETSIAAGPPERVWSARTVLLEVPPGIAQGELHLIKNDDASDFLVDDVSLRRIVAAPDSFTLESPAGASEWISPVLFLGAVSSADLEVRLAPASSEAIVETRTGLAPDPGSSWETWRSSRPGSPGASKGPVHLFAEGVSLYAQVRVRGKDGTPDRAAARWTLTLRATPTIRAALSRRVSFTSVANGPSDPGQEWSTLKVPDRAACMEGALGPIHSLALRAIDGVEGEMARAQAILGAVRSWLPFSPGGKPPGGSGTPDPAHLFEDCRRGTPLYCRSMQADLMTAACWCTGMICRAVSSAEAGSPQARIEGTEFWSSHSGRWIYLPWNADAGSAGPPSPAEFGSAGDLARRRGVPVAVATDLTWGRRGFKILGPPATAPADPNAPAVGPTSGWSLTSSINTVHVDLAAAADRSVEVRLTHAMPGFARYLCRFSRSAEWKPVSVPLVWNLAPGENSLEVVAENAMGGRGNVTSIRARVYENPADRAAAYAGLRALGGDPHVHTGLGIYRILDPNHPLATGTPDEAFASAVRNGLDWAAVTDYSGNIDDRRTIEWRRSKGTLLRNPDGSTTGSEWDHLEAVVRKANQPGRFAAFLGVEYSAEGFTSKGGSGRKLILLPDESAEIYCSPGMQNAGDCPVVRDAYRYTRAHGGVMIASTPCAAAGREDTDWSQHDPIVALMEMSGGACEKAPGGLVDAAVRRGIVIGAGGGSDSRDATAGTYDRTICFASEISRASILDAIRARRCYWSAAGHLDLEFTLNGAPIGSEVPAGNVTAWSVTARGVTSPDFGSVEILRDGEVIASAPCESPSRCFMEGGVGEGWPGVYYAAISAPDGARLAITSPVRLTAGPPR